MTDYASRRAVLKQAGYDRVVVDGVDITNLRVTGPSDPQVQVPDYLLTEPFGYGPSEIKLPMVDGNLETLGVGDLAFIREGARVEYQRVDDPKAETPVILAVDYVGRLLAPDVNGREVTLEVGGEFSGPASMIDKQHPLIRRLRDTGFWAANVLERLSLFIADRDGPTTGEEIVEAGGGGSLADWAADVCAWSQTDAGVQRAIMPVVWGGNEWAFEPKDTTTVNLTLFTDDARVTVQLRDDLVEKTNTWFGTGVAPDGERWQNARLPGIISGDPPPYPNSGGATITVGDTDADTDSSDGVTVMNHKLVAMGLLDVTQDFVYGSYTTATARAVKGIQRRDGLTVNGVMNPATWDALYDNSATGWSTSDAHISPLYQDPRVQPFFETANGSLAGLNPDYDATMLRVDRTIDFGPGVTKAQATAWCVGQAARLAGDHLTGTVTLAEGFGGFIGDWSPGDEPTADDIMAQRDIRPGMNAKLPMFQGGILVHIAGVSVSKGQVVLTVDTLARDLLELAALMSRRVEAKRSIRREFHESRRPNKRSGNMVEHDELFGWLSSDVACQGDSWTHFPIPAAQAGTLRRTWTETRNSHAAGAMIVSTIELTPARLNRHVPNPLAPVGEDDEPWWESGWAADMMRRDKIIYAAGTNELPMGYWPKKHTNMTTGATTSAPITGEHIDDGSWDYFCDPANDCILWVAYYADRDTILQRRRILYVQGNDSI